MIDSSCETAVQGRRCRRLINHPHRGRTKTKDDYAAQRFSAPRAFAFHRLSFFLVLSLRAGVA
jgi:hypothetical protein